MEYFWCVKEILDQLNVARYVVSNKKKVEQQTLSGLGTELHVFTIVLEVLSSLPFFNELQGKLLQHEMNIKQLTGGSDQGNSPNVLMTGDVFRMISLNCHCGLDGTERWKLCALVNSCVYAKHSIKKTHSFYVHRHLEFMADTQREKGNKLN